MTPLPLHSKPSDDDRQRTVDRRESSRSGATRATVACVVFGAACALATVPLVVLASRDGSDRIVGEWLFGTFTPGFLVAGWWLLSRRPGVWIGRLYLVGGLSTAITGLAAGYAAAVLADRGPGLAWAMWIVSISWSVHSGAMTVVLVLFPRATPRHRLDAWLIAFGVALTAGQIVSAAVRPGYIVTTPDHSDGAPAHVINPVGVEALRGVVDVLDLVWAFLGLLTALVLVVLLGVRWRRSADVEQRQYRWAFLVAIAWLIVVPLVLGIPGGTIGPALAIVTTIALQLLVVVAVLRWDIYDARIVLRRSAVAAGLLGGALTVYGAVVLVAAVAVGGFGPLPATLGAMVAVFAFGPMSSWIRRSVDRLFYGRRAEPYEVLAALGRGQANATDPDDALHRLVAAIAAELRVPAVVLEDVDGIVLSAVGDTTTHRYDEIELRHLGERVGALNIALRTGTDQASDADRRIAGSLAGAVAAVVAFRRAAVELQRANEEMVVARDAERLRFQRDLHDGLGPRLTAVVFKTEALANHLRAGRVDAALALADDACAELSSGVEEIRRYIHALGDPALASAGLRRTLIDRIERLTAQSGVDVDVAIGDLGDLSAAVERAVISIVSEACTNVVRHADASRCEVEVARHDGRVEIQIADDGRGLTDGDPIGVGISSMRHRAVELGGSFRLDGNAPGTRVGCVLPVAT